MKKILILGYMGSGKSLIGKLLAERLEIPFFDLDDLIENRLELSISEIFQQKGEIFFRKIEHQIFKEMMDSRAIFVLSLGGGTPCYANNHLLLTNDNCISIYLKASIETLHNRLFSGRSSRPLIADLKTNEFKEYIAKHLFDRSYFYNQAIFKVSVNEKLPAEIVLEIQNSLT
jgi:shikimate kinase